MANLTKLNSYVKKMNYPEVNITETEVGDDEIMACVVIGAKRYGIGRNCCRDVAIEIACDQTLTSWLSSLKDDNDSFSVSDDDDVDNKNPRSSNRPLISLKRKPPEVRNSGGKNLADKSHASVLLNLYNAAAIDPTESSQATISFTEIVDINKVSLLTSLYIFNVTSNFHFLCQGKDICM
jgi:hypothetical protein